MLEQKEIDAILDTSLEEDIGSGDITSQSIIAENAVSTFAFVAREPLVVCGLPVLQRLYEREDETIGLCVKEGQKVAAGETIMKIHGNVRMIFQTERVALNLLQHMCAIATLTRKFVASVEGTKAVIRDTRKTTPGLRSIEKYAVVIGGGENHRMRLDDGILIKDNHISICGSIKEAVDYARSGNPDMQIEVECDTIAQVEEAIAAGTDIILLDNMPLDMMQEAARLNREKALLEASGGVTLDNVRDIAETGVDYIAVGALTHSAQNVDIGLDKVNG